MKQLTLAERIGTRRTELGISRAELADAVGVTEAAIGQWELGKVKNLRLDHLVSLADALNVRVRWLAVGAGAREESRPEDAYSTALARRDEAKSYSEKKGWERIAAIFARAAVLVALALPGFAPDKAEASVLHNVFVSGIHICARLFRMLKDFASQELAISLSRVIDGHQDKFIFC